VTTNFLLSTITEMKDDLRALHAKVDKMKAMKQRLRQLEADNAHLNSALYQLRCDLSGAPAGQLMPVATSSSSSASSTSSPPGQSTSSFYALQYQQQQQQQQRKRPRLVGGDDYALNAAEMMWCFPFFKRFHNIPRNRFVVDDLQCVPPCLNNYNY
jgi:hypothetical protein